jgi:hypothetical protein
MAKTIERMEKQLADAKKRIIELEDLLSNKWNSEKQNDSQA